MPKSIQFVFLCANGIIASLHYRVGRVFQRIERIGLDGAGCNLSVVTQGPKDGPVVVFVHGMRDHAMAMLLMAEMLPGHRIIAPDLRGHGDSDKPGVYGLVQFLADLHAVFNHFEISSAVLVGHSLGGHIAARFASIYPGVVSKLILLDGMGPPGSSDQMKAFSDEQVVRWQQTIEMLLYGKSTGRLMHGRSEALDRFRQNNPTLDDEALTMLVVNGITEVPGGVTWKWDPRVNMIWMTFSQAESELAYKRIGCAVLVVTGDRGMDYWKDMMPLEGKDAYYNQELDRRTALFPRGERVVIEDAGHMLHYDQPRAVGEAILAFINQ